MKRLCLAVAVVLMLGAGLMVSAQAPSFLTTDELLISAAHDGLRTTTYTINIGGAKPYTASLPVSALVNGVITFDVLPLGVQGNYSVTISAVGPGGTTTTAPFGFALGDPKPSSFGPITVTKK